MQTGLPAYDCQYHSRCYHKFRKVPGNTAKANSCRPVDAALQHVIIHMKGDMHVTWTLAELHKMYSLDLQMSKDNFLESRWWLMSVTILVMTLLF